jgi:hypothetical protein
VIFASRNQAAAVLAADDLPDSFRGARGDPDPAAQRAPLRRVAPQDGRLQRPVGGDTDGRVLLQREAALGEKSFPLGDLGRVLRSVRKLLVQVDVTGFPLRQEKARLGGQPVVGMP